MKQVLAALGRRMHNLIRTGCATRVSAQFAQVQFAENDIRDLPVVSPFGVATHAPDGAQAVVLSLAGDAEGGGFVIQLPSTEGKPDIAQGESALYSKAGNHIHIKKDGTVVIQADKVDLGGTGGKGVVTGGCICPFTGNYHADFSTKILAVKQ